MKEIDPISALRKKAKSSPLTEDERAMARQLIELSECMAEEAIEEAFIAFDWMDVLGADGMDSAQAALERAEEKSSDWTDKIMIIWAWLQMSELPGATREYCRQRAFAVQERAERETGDAEGLAACACSRMKLKGPESKAIAWHFMMMAEEACSTPGEAESIVMEWLSAFGYEGYCEAKRFMNSLISTSDGMKNLHIHLPHWFWNSE